MKGLSSWHQREWRPGSPRKLSLPDFLHAQAKTEPRCPLAQWVARLPQALAAHLGPRSQSTASSPGAHFQGRSRWDKWCGRAAVWGRDPAPGCRAGGSGCSSRGGHRAGASLPASLASSAPVPRDRSAPLGPYLEPWERRCPGRPRTWAHVTGQSGVRPGQGAVTGGRSCPGHGLRRLLGPGGQSWRWGGPEARGRRLRAGAGAPY